MTRILRQFGACEESAYLISDGSTEGVAEAHMLSWQYSGVLENFVPGVRFPKVKVLLHCSLMGQS